MKKIIDWIIEQEHESIDTYSELVLPLADKFNIEISCAESIIDTVVEWETDANTIHSLEELLTFRFPDLVIN